MLQEPTIRDVIEAIQDLSSSNDRQFAEIRATVATKAELGSVKTELGSVKTELGSVKTELGSVKTELGSFKDVFLRYKIGAEERFSKMATKNDLQELKQDILTHIDGFAKHHKTVDVEILSLRSASLRHEERIMKLEEAVSEL